MLTLVDIVSSVSVTMTGFYGGIFLSTSINRESDRTDFILGRLAKNSVLEDGFLGEVPNFDISRSELSFSPNLTSTN